MTCNLPRPAPQVLFDRLRDMFSATVLGGSPVIPESNEWYVVSNDYAAAETFYALAEQQWRERDPRVACCDNLIDMAALDGIYPRPATFARGYVKISGTVGAALTTSLQVAFGESLYRVDQGVTVPAEIPASGYVIVRMIADEPGTDGNGPAIAATGGRLITPLAGISVAVEIYGGQFCGGQPAEDCETFRARYLARKQYQPKSTFEWVKAKILEWPCATRVCIRDCACCTERGRMDLFVFFDGTFPFGIPPADVLADLEAWFFGDPQGFGLGQAEWGMYGTFHAARAVPVNVTIVDLPCTSTAQLEEIKARVAGMFDGLCPGKPICRRFVDAIVLQVVGKACEFTVTLEPVGTTTAFCDDFNPACDELPVAGTVTVRGGSLTL